MRPFRLGVDLLPPADFLDEFFIAGLAVLFAQFSDIRRLVGNARMTKGIELFTHQRLDNLNRIDTAPFRFLDNHSFYTLVDVERPLFVFKLVFLHCNRLLHSEYLGIGPQINLPAVVEDGSGSMPNSVVIAGIELGRQFRPVSSRRFPSG